MSDRLPNARMRYLSQVQTLPCCADMGLHMDPSLPHGRCVCLCRHICSYECQLQHWHNVKLENKTAAKKWRQNNSLCRSRVQVTASTSAMLTERRWVWLKNKNKCQIKKQFLSLQSVLGNLNHSLSLLLCEGLSIFLWFDAIKRLEHYNSQLCWTCYVKEVHDFIMKIHMCSVKLTSPQPLWQTLALRRLPGH